MTLGEIERDDCCYQFDHIGLGPIWVQQGSMVEDSRVRGLDIFGGIQELL